MRKQNKTTRNKQRNPKQNQNKQTRKKIQNTIQPSQLAKVSQHNSGLGGKKILFKKILTSTNNFITTDGLQRSGFSLEQVFNSHSLLLCVLHVIYPTGKSPASDLYDPNSLFNRMSLQWRSCSGPSQPGLGVKVKENLVQTAEERDRSPLSGTSSLLLCFTFHLCKIGLKMLTI